MSEFLISKPNGFTLGYTPITFIGEPNHDTGINFGILKLQQGEKITLQHPLESVYLLLQGKCECQMNSILEIATRQSFFDDAPFAIHLAPNAQVNILALSDCEFAVSQVENLKSFSSSFFNTDNLLENEQRGKGLLNDTACRLVRTIIDTRNCPDSKLVIGEVLTAPGRWSSYPPHHHPHPEIYHYRFTEPQGYGHAECGDQVFKVKQFDTYKILNENDHAQTAAPGYGMYYIWVIRHLDNNPYHQPVFTQEHTWTQSKDANQRVWKSYF